MPHAEQLPFSQRSGGEVPAFRFGARRRNGNFLPLWILTEFGLTYGRQFARTRVDPPAIRWTTRENIGKLEVTEGQDRIPYCLTCRQALPGHADNEEIVSDFVLQTCAGDRRCHCLPDGRECDLPPLHTSFSANLRHKSTYFREINNGKRTGKPVDSLQACRGFRCRHQPVPYFFTVHADL